MDAACLAFSTSINTLSKVSDNMSFLCETHFHTPLTSHCGVVHPKEAVPKYIENGYKAIFTTDHYYKEWFYEREKEGLSWEEKIDMWLTGYNTACECAGADIKVFLGMELRYFDGTVDDHLVYGITPELLKSNPELYLLTPMEFKKFADENGLFIAQAHPFRDVCHVRKSEEVHGIEVFNGNGRWNSHDDVARKYAEDNRLVMLSGSDFHEWEDLCTGGVYLSEMPSSNEEVAEFLKTKIVDLK